MTEVAITMFRSIFRAIVSWMETIFTRIGATDIILIVVTISLLSSLIIRPIRGSANQVSALSEFSATKVNSVKSNRNKFGRGKDLAIYDD